MRLGLFGGSFDPVHHAHLIVAQSALEQLGLDRVLLLVSAAQPLKSGHGAAALDRLRMVELAVEGIPGLVADGREVARGGPTYTIDTLREVAAEFPGAELILILGTDAAAELPRWREAEAVRRMARVAVVDRAGTPRPEGVAAIAVPTLELSSTAIRARAAAGRSLRGWVPERVADYISGLALYRTEGGTA